MPETSAPITLSSGETRIQVDALRASSGECGVLVLATSDVDMSELVGESGGIVVPAATRTVVEAAINELADLIALCSGVSPRILSPRPAFALIDLSAEERVRLTAAGPLTFGVPPWTTRIVGPRIDPVPFANLPFHALGDRSDGVRLFAESRATTHATSRFRELCRVFERGFKLGPFELIDPLWQFLRIYEALEFTRDEVAHWLGHLRHLAVHADRRDQFAVATDVQAFLSRLEFAAFDVVMNKHTWRDPSSERRDVWDPEFGPLGDGLVLAASGRVPYVIEHRDSFGIYVQSKHRVDVPADWLLRDETDYGQPFSAPPIIVTESLKEMIAPIRPGSTE